MYRIGVLGLQGGVVEHMQMLDLVRGVNAVQVRKPSDLAALDGLILPGGESTVMGKLLHRLEMLEPIKKAIGKGLPVWGTCAGMILLAKNIENQSDSYLGVLDATVSRNAFGRQLESFDTIDTIEAVSDEPLKMRFVRAPRIVDWNRAAVQVIYQLEGFPVAVRQENLLATSFHPELVGEHRFHEYFVTHLVAKNYPPK